MIKTGLLITFFIICFGIVFECSAQQNFRLGGICGSSFSRYITPKDYPQNDLKLKVGIYPKVVCRLPLKRGFWFQTEVGLADYGSKIVYEYDSIHQILKESRYFIQFTELLGYSLKIDKEKRLKLNFEGGPFFGYYLFSHQYNRTENLVDHSISKEKEFRNICREDPMLNKYVVGISAGTGISKEIYRGTILLDFRYDLSLTKVSKYPDNPEYPGINTYYYQLFSLSVGYLFGQNKW
jgi:hypothetical protein